MVTYSFHLYSRSSDHFIPDVTKSGNEERGTGNRERGSGNDRSAVSAIKIQNGGLQSQ